MESESFAAAAKDKWTFAFDLHIKGSLGNEDDNKKIYNYAKWDHFCIFNCFIVFYSKEVISFSGNCFASGFLSDDNFLFRFLPHGLFCIRLFVDRRRFKTFRRHVDSIWIVNRDREAWDKTSTKGLRDAQKTQLNCNSCMPWFLVQVCCYF